MANVTIYDVYNALGITEENGTQTLINAIRNSTELKGITQLYDGTVSGLENFGVAVNRTSRTQNIFVNELIDRIGVVVINKTDLRNPLKRFKKGRMDNGRIVQEIATDLIKAQSFNPEDASHTLLKRYPPNARVLYHDNWRKELYPTTIEETTLRQAFTSLSGFEDFVTGVYDSMYNSNEVDEYLWTKGLIESYVANGFATYVPVPVPSDNLSASEFVKKTRATSTKFQLPQGTRLFNASGIHVRTPKSRMWLLIDADLDATLDVDVLSRAFNMDKTQLQDQKILVENFGVSGLQAVLFDENIFQIRDKEFRMNSVENAKGLYWNVFLHVHQMFSMGKFHNFVAFMSGDIPPITKLTVTPMTSYITTGVRKTLDGYIELREGVTLDDVELTATVVNEVGATVSGATVTLEDTDQYGFKVHIDVTNADLVDQNLTVNVIATEVVEEEGDPFIRIANALIVPLPKPEV